MTKVDFVYFDAGGGHRSSALALAEVIKRRQFPWDVRMVNLQEILDPIDVIRRIAGVRIQDVYNSLLKKGWTLGSDYLLKLLQAVIALYHKQEVMLLTEHWQAVPADLVVSLVPHFNRALFESLDSRVPFVTVLTDLADFPPHFWMESQRQYFICGSDKAVEQALACGIEKQLILRSSGMIINPNFYERPPLDRALERRKLGLHESLPTGLVLFGGQGSKSMLEIAHNVNESRLKVQLIFVCGHNQALADELRQLATHFPKVVQGFTREVPYFMSISDFFIGKPGPGSISEALVMGLPVIVERNAWTLPQERYNCEWVLENEIGMVLKNFGGVSDAIARLLDPQTSSRLRSNTIRLENRAVFEIPDMLNRILLEHGSAHLPAYAAR